MYANTSSSPTTEHAWLALARSASEQQQQRQRQQQQQQHVKHEDATQLRTPSVRKMPAPHLSSSSSPYLHAPATSSSSLSSLRRSNGSINTHPPPPPPPPRAPIVPRPRAPAVASAWDAHLLLPLIHDVNGEIPPSHSHDLNGGVESSLHTTSGEEVQQQQQQSTTTTLLRKGKRSWSCMRSFRPLIDDSASTEMLDTTSTIKSEDVDHEREALINDSDRVAQSVKRIAGAPPHWSPSQWLNDLFATTIDAAIDDNDGMVYYLAQHLSFYHPYAWWQMLTLLESDFRRQSIQHKYFTPFCEYWRRIVHVHPAGSNVNGDAYRYPANHAVFMNVVPDDMTWYKHLLCNYQALTNTRGDDGRFKKYHFLANWVSHAHDMRWMLKLPSSSQPPVDPHLNGLSHRYSACNHTTLFFLCSAFMLQIPLLSPTTGVLCHELKFNLVDRHLNDDDEEGSGDGNDDTDVVNRHFSPPSTQRECHVRMRALDQFERQLLFWTRLVTQIFGLSLTTTTTTTMPSSSNEQSSFIAKMSCLGDLLERPSTMLMCVVMTYRAIANHIASEQASQQQWRGEEKKISIDTTNTAAAAGPSTTRTTATIPRSDTPNFARVVETTNRLIDCRPPPVTVVAKGAHDKDQVSPQDSPPRENFDVFLNNMHHWVHALSGFMLDMVGGGGHGCNEDDNRASSSMPPFHHGSRKTHFVDIEACAVNWMECFLKQIMSASRRLAQARLCLLQYAQLMNWTIT